MRIDATGVCHSDLHVLETGFNHPLPVLLGHEGAGVVEAVGEGVETVDVGETRRARLARAVRRLPAGASAATSTCAGRPRPRARGCASAATATSRARSAWGRSPTGSSPTSAPRFPSATCRRSRRACSAARSRRASARRSAPRASGPARASGVIGCGAVGLCVIQGARIAGAAEVHALDLDERKLEAARRFGATHTGEATRLDFVFDVVGRPETVEQGVAMLGHAGTLVYIGLPHPDAPRRPLAQAGLRPARSLPRLPRRRPRPGARLPAARRARAGGAARPRRNGLEDDRVGGRRAGVRGDEGGRRDPIGRGAVKVPPPVAELLGIELVEVEATAAAR